MSNIVISVSHSISDVITDYKGGLPCECSFDLN
jgi:hypothetical protein